MAYHHYDTFREELLKTYPAFGHALWDPNPGEYPPVEVGDVGFVRQGKFHRIFNPLYSEDHPSNQRFGVPGDHEQLQPIPNHIDRETRALDPNTYYSYGVSVLSGGLEALGSIGSAKVSFSCTKKQGAALTLPVAALREDTLTQDRFRKWIITHIDSWFAFTQELGLGIGIGDIILVTGYHRTRSWSNITFNEVQTDAQFLLGVEVAPGALSASINWQASNLRIQGAVPKHGPSGENLPNNQCIFIRGFRIKHTFLGKLPRIKAAAEPKPDPRMPGSYPESDEEVVSIPSVSEYQDPLDVLLEYIAKRAPHCEMALVHDDDLERILGVGDRASLEIFKPDVMMDYLERSKPEIESTSHPSPANDTIPIPRTDTGHVTVAMLSAQLKSLDIANRAPLQVRDRASSRRLRDMALVHDDDREQILGIGARTSPPQPDVRPLRPVGLRPPRSPWPGITPGPWHFDASANDTNSGVMSLPFGPSLAPGTDHSIRFSWPQELKRPEVGVHIDNPSRQCPFCLYQWTRADKIKTHLVEVHRDVLSAEILDQIRARRGNYLVKFLDTYEHLRGNVIPQAGGSSALPFPAPTEETTELPKLPHPLSDYDIAEQAAIRAMSRFSRSKQPNEPRGSP